MNTRGLPSNLRMGKAAAKGFSLIELLIVVFIILIISAIAIPSLFRSKIAANESSAVSSIRQINTAEGTYASSWGSGGTPQHCRILAARRQLARPERRRQTLV